MRIAYSLTTRLYAQGPLRRMFRAFEGLLLAVISAFWVYPALGQETTDVFGDEPDFMRLRAERFANAQDSLDLVDFYHGMGEEDWMDHRGWLAARAKTAGAAVAAHESDSLALVDFYHAAGGEDWIDRTGWLKDPVMDWYGVVLNEEGRVVALSMHDNNLTGTISASLGELGKLKEIHLDRNSLTGSIPPKLGNLAQLDILDISDNDLTGSIPASLQGLAKLKYLYIDYNSLTGSIPPELGNLAQLKVLSISDNDLTGSIPASLQGLAKLKYLYISYNSLTGSIPPELGNLAQLEVLDIRNNDLTGSIPRSLGRLFRLRRLLLGVNNFTGLIPFELGNLAELKYLNLQRNALRLPIPASLGRLTKLEYFDLAGNRLTGPIPPILGELAQLRYLSLRWNRFTGSIPRWLERLTQLDALFLDSNSLTGPIPPELGNLTKLQALRLNHNDLTGAIPAWLGKLSDLFSIYLGDNALTGSIPPSLGNLANLTYLDLSNNPLDPYDFPAWIMNLDEFEVLNLSNTRLRGTIPSELFDLPRIWNLALSHNDLEGALPDNIANAKTLSHLYINANYLNALPDLSGLPKLFYVRVFLNRLTFEDFEDRERPASVRDYEYAPQRRVPTHVARSAFHATFSVEVGGTANKYQWYREGSMSDEAVPGATSDTFVVSLSDPPLCYYCKITNAKVPDLTLYSECVSVDDADMQATPDVEASTYALWLEEGGDPGSYMLALRTDPGGTVTVTPSSSNEESATVSGALSFDRSNWQAPQTVTVTPVADANLDDDTVTITHVVAGYPGVPVGPVVTVTVADATIIISAEEEQEQGIPAAFALEQNYPNPFNPSTTIAFTLNKTQRATLSVYDLLGQKVQTLVDGMRPAARYRIPFDASELASGTYLYVLRTEEEIAVKTMLLVK